MGKKLAESYFSLQDVALIEMVEAPESMKEDVWKLFVEYSRELSQYHDRNKRQDNRNPCFDEYWDEPNRTPLAILYDHELAGFCLLTEKSVCYVIDEFYVHPIHRRRGFGSRAISKVKEICAQDARHDTLAANIYVNNMTALAFWKSVGFHDTGRRIRIGNVRLIESELRLDYKGTSKSATTAL